MILEYIMGKDKVTTIDNKWDNVYWFSRMLISSDKYGGVGKDNKLLSEISSLLRIIKKEKRNKKNILELQKISLRNYFNTKFRAGTNKFHKVQKFLEDIEVDIQTEADMDVFILTCENIMIPINDALKNIPNDDKIYAKSIAKAFLDLHGEDGVAKVVNLWDDLGVKGCLTTERTQIVKKFGLLREYISNKLKLNNEDNDIILTAFVQEFERRVGQKRKSRAGGSLEDVTAFILKYYGIKSASKPEHFQADMEVDNWIKTKDGWLIGISCKRTLRERWKQVSTGNVNLLSKFKIKYIYHVITFDQDLSDEKLALLGGQRQIFYLPDESEKFKKVSKQIGLKNYVRPMSKFIEDIRKEI